MTVITSPTRPHRLDLVRSTTKSSAKSAASSVGGAAKCAQKGHKGRLVFKPVDYGYLVNPYTMIWRIMWIRENAEIKCKRCDLVLRGRSSGGCCPFSKTHKKEEPCDKVAEEHGQRAIRDPSSVPPPIAGSEGLPTYDEAVPVPSGDRSTETWKESELKLRTALPQA